MSSSLLSNTNNLQQHQANILTNRPNHIKVLVEDEEDVVLWHKILTLWRQDKIFDVTPYSHVPSVADSKGKGHILQMANQFGPYFIGCVDSDYDYLLENHTEDGRTIKNNQYILQTFGYSIENLVCQPYGISDKLLECKKHSCDIQRNADADFTVFITEISKALYPVLLWHLILKKENLRRNDWSVVFGNNLYQSILRDNFLTFKQKRIQVISLIRNLLSQAENNYTKAYPDLISAKEALENDLSTNYGLNPDNAFLFVRGHDLFEFLHFTFFTPLENLIYNDHIADIKKNLPEKETSDAIGHYCNIISKFKALHITSCEFLKDPDNLITLLLENSVKALPL